jgi:transposase InsO family protein
VVATARWLVLRGYRLARIAKALGVALVTLKKWRKRWKESRLQARPRGRPAERSDRESRNAVLTVLGLMGPDVSVATVQDLFPDMSRAELKDLLRRWRSAYCRKNSYQVHALRWTRPGTVWAMDFAQSPHPIDGLFPYLFVVRDLSSSKQLLCLPLEQKDEANVLAALRALFVRHPPPIVLKCDNERSFKTERVEALLEAHGVIPLYSPPGIPSYNGACESGIGTIKTFAHHESARQDRPGYWTSDDVEAARQRANQYTRPRGPLGPTPAEAWSELATTNLWNRRLFRRLYEREYREAVKERGLLPLLPIDRSDKEALDRIAIGKALIAGGFLCIRRRRVSPPRSLRKRVCTLVR